MCLLLRKYLNRPEYDILSLDRESLWEHDNLLSRVANDILVVFVGPDINMEALACFHEHPFHSTSNLEERASRKKATPSLARRTGDVNICSDGRMQ